MKTREDNLTRSTIFLTICVLSVLLVHEVAGLMLESKTISTEGSIWYDEVDYVRPFGFRIADMMVDLLPPNFDDQWYSAAWQEALDDLAHASPNGEITHVQMRMFWTINTGLDSTAEDWIDPQLGSPDPGQAIIMENWKRWFFGHIDPDDAPLAYGPCAIERIQQKGFKYELCVSGGWHGGDPAKPPMFIWDEKESDYPDWMALGGGETFLDNYLNNVLLPVVNFVKDYMENGDVFMLSFEMVYPTADFTWSHNEKWTSIISAVRDEFRAAGKKIVLTIDNCGWYDDAGLGYNAVKLLNSSAPLPSEFQGISGASYLGELDFISVSHWLPLVLPSEIPANWSDADTPWVTDTWFNNLHFEKVGTGYGGIPGILGRDIIADYRALSTIMGKKIILNTGWENRHAFLSSSPRRTTITPDNQEQRVAWAAQLAALGDPRSNFTAWCAGQDFERYCRDKALQPTFIDASWRRSPAESAIIEGIQAILSEV